MLADMGFTNRFDRTCDLSLEIEAFSNLTEATFAKYTADFVLAFNVLRLF